MSLTRDRVTVASRLMLPTHALFSLALGTVWIVQADERTAIPSLYALRELWPIEATGGVLVGVGLLQLAGMVTHRRFLDAVFLLVGCLAYLLLAVAIAASVLSQPASYSAAAWPVYIAVAHLASALSLAADEWTDEGHTNRRGLA